MNVLLRRIGTVTLAVVVAAPPVTTPAKAAAQARRPTAPPVPAAVSVPVGSVPVRPMPADPADAAAWRKPPAVDWPSPGQADLSVGGPETGFGGLGVALEPPDVAAPSGEGPRSVRAQVLDRETTERAGVNGVLLRLSLIGGGGPVSVRLDYSRFRYAYGGDWTRRLRLLALPPCVLSVPGAGGCTQATPIPFVNDPAAGTISAELSPAGTEVVMALTAGSSSDAGDYAATSLAASATWTAGGSSGDFGWSYPLRVPPGVGGPEPRLSVAYSAQSVDGRTAASNNQPSWIGEGFDLAGSFVERKYASCADDGQPGKYDLCWKYDNASLVLNGSASELVRDDASGVWRLKDDDGSRVEKLTNPVANGDNDREYWRVTTVDGTQYVFGRHQLPGWASGNPYTNSVWTVPVAGDDNGEPCHSSSGFAASFCTQAWRWNLDYAVDPHGNVMTAWYSPETNYYAKNGVASPGTAYHRGGWLARIEYGQRTSTIFTAAAPARVVFTVAERCIPAGTETCTTLSSSNKSAWPDVPFDQICNAGSACTGRLAPTFFTRKRLTTVGTEVWRGTAHAKVDTWSLTQSFPAPGDGGTPSLWLSKITHSGNVGATVSLAPVTFGGTQLDNRVDALEGIAPVTKWRVRTITSETGATTVVNYAPTECTRAALPSPASNTKRCFPVYWTPPGQTDPQLDWFHKYVVAQVLEVDNTGGGEIVQTDYGFGGGAAWHYDDDDGLTPNKYRTWSGWRGYQTVTVTTGDPVLGGLRAKEYALYLRGMDGDRTAGGGTKTVSVTDSQGGVVTDSAPLAGEVREEITYDGTAVVDGTITDYWTQQSAARTQSWGTVRAHLVRTAATRTRTPLAAGGARTTRVSYAYDSTWGLPVQTDDLGDEATAGDDQCTRYEYARNSSAYLIDYRSRTEIVGVRCGGTVSRPADVVSDQRTWYDGQPYGAAPTIGNPTRTERVADYVAGSPLYQTVSTSSFDGQGRVTQVKDALTNATTTAYTPASGGPLTRTVVTNPLGHATTTDLDPAWGAATKSTDPNGKLTERSYDGLGRLTAAWLPNRSRSGGQNPNRKFAYTVSATAPVAIATSTLRSDGTSYTTSYEIVDSWLRPRQTQQPAPGGGRVITDTSYDSRGHPVRTLGDVYNTAAPAATLAAVNAGAAPAQSQTLYDGAGRTTAEIFLVLGEERWRTTTNYGGDRVSVDPPDGDVATTEIEDGRGRVVERWEYDGGAPTGSHTTTRYGYDDADRLLSIVDTAGTAWTYAYDLRGRQIRAADPDKGVTITSYDDLDRAVSTTDARGQTLAYTYDALGRDTGRYAGSVAPANQLAGWTYDTISGAVGQPVAATRYVGGATGAAYTSKVVSYDALYRPTQQQTVIPAVEGTLAGTYSSSTAYNLDGTVQLTTLPAAGGLPTEVLTYGHNELGMPTTLTGLAGYVADTVYSKLGQPEQYTLAASTAAKHVWLTMTYEAGTRRMTRAFVADETNPTAPADRGYSYDQAGNPTRVADVAGAADDVQCFGYDGHRRLTQAWTPSSGSCADAPGTVGLGGPAPYWLSWTYTDTGLRATQVDHRAGGDVTTAYAYPAPTAPRPHTLTSATTTGLGTASYGYDAAGNTTGRPGVSGPQTVTWDAEGRSATITEATNVSQHLYDAGGDRLIRRDPTETVLYLGATEVHRSAGGALTAVRHYAHNGVTVATRTGTGVSWLIPDHQGTPLVAIDAVTQAVQKRYQTPFGGPRGTAPTGWPSQKGYVGGVTDPAAGLVRLGARDYDPTTGRFLSVDPVLAPEDPQSLAAYTYANNNPVTHADSSGMMVDASGGGGTSPAKKKKSSAGSSGSRAGSGGTGGGSSARRGGCTNRYQCEEVREVHQQQASHWRCANRYQCEEKRQVEQEREQKRRRMFGDPRPPDKPKKKCGFFSTCIFTDPGRWVGDRRKSATNMIDSDWWTYTKFGLGVVALFVCTVCTVAAGIGVGMSLVEAGVHASNGDWGKAGVSAVGVATFGAVGTTGRLLASTDKALQSARGLPWTPVSPRLLAGAEREYRQAFIAHATAGVADFSYSFYDLTSEGVDVSNRLETG